MSNPFVAEIRIVGFNFAPTGWAFCNGQILPLSQNTALFSLLGTTYGGNGMSNFALPDLQARMPMHPGQGPGLSQHDLGEAGGSESVTLLDSQMPVHRHTVQSAAGSVTDKPTGAALGSASNLPYVNAAPDATMAASALSPVGGNSPHNNMPPYLTMNFIIALQGVFPQRP